MGVIAIAVALALVPVGKTGASYDADAHTLSARGAAAADPRAPNADIARVKAERTARLDATKSLKAGLKSLGYKGDEATVDKLVEKGTSTPDYGADGSVTMTLTISTESLKGIH